ncbi:F0F1 ATP synthase subunit B' [endosymbiont of Acanthamoeba sp. UWC8]|uniref:F0F1 ATP synthase subunit B family protein n=1 Tax=endosymbiont of Acanthamoeba sp. UWC8 TaxID=86106 RepID=UPI0004D0D7D8|nr:hypothetical protein [endosymbiont of Acanthamoeba sp. UWC8]AIF81761.1 F0F1 ATP synthase subunit B' [endosymbiont of Acanthamoeba sp. UWC8]
MPQLDISSFSLQLFWLAVIFPLLYLFIAKFFLPTISEVVKNRALRVKIDLVEAEKMITNHKALKSEIAVTLSEARTKALNLKADVVLDAKKASDKEIKEFETALAEKTTENLNKLEVIKLQLKSELPAVVKDLSEEIFKTVLDEFHNSSQKVN